MDVIALSRYEGEPARENRVSVVQRSEGGQSRISVIGVVYSALVS